MEKSEILNLENRRLIYNLIIDNPGLHLREIARRLNLRYFNLNYHINYLKRLGMISIKKDDSYSRVYPKDCIGKNEKQVLNILRKKTPRRIIIYIFYSGATTQRDIAENLEKDPTTIKYHLSKLKELDLIESAPIKDGIALIKMPSNRNLDRKPVKNETLYRFKDPEMLKKLLISHKKSLYKDKIFKISMEYLIYCSAYHRKNKTKRNVKTSEWWAKYYEDIFYDIFPHPYHV